MKSPKLKYPVLAAALLLAAGVAWAQAPSKSTAPVPANTQTNTQPAPDAAEAPPTAPQGGTALLLRGLDKITGRPTNITAPIGKQVTFATLTITVRYCYSTPPSETPETSAFLQIDDRRPDQPARRVFSGWMYASSPGLNGLEHPLYDVWVIRCQGGTVPATTTASAAPSKPASPDSSDRENLPDVPLR